MLFIEILVAFVAISVVVIVFGINIYKRIRGTYKGECESCSKSFDKNLKKIRKEIDKECLCHKMTN